MSYEFDFDADIREMQGMFKDGSRRVKDFVDKQRQILNQKRQIKAELEEENRRNGEAYKRETAHIKNNIESLQAQSKSRNFTSKQQESDKQQLISEIQNIEKNFEKYNTELNSLKEAYRRFRGERAQENQYSVSLESEIKTYETLYGVKITVYNGVVKFVFVPFDYTLELDSGDRFSLKSSNLPSKILINKLIDELNASDSEYKLLPFLAEIRSQL